MRAFIAVFVATLILLLPGRAFAGEGEAFSVMIRIRKPVSVSIAEAITSPARAGKGAGDLHIKTPDGICNFKIVRRKKRVLFKRVSSAAHCNTLRITSEQTGAPRLEIVFQ